MTATGPDIHPFRQGMISSDLREVVSLYNRALQGVHGFYPITRRIFRQRILGSPCYQPDLFLMARQDGKLAGMLHAAALREPCHETGGVISMIAVEPELQRQGIGSALLKEALASLKTKNMPLCDGGGCFPFSPFYATLLDGSERSGIDNNNTPALGLFRKQGFTVKNESLIMRCHLAGQAMNDDDRSEYELSIRPRDDQTTWLDHVFRGWHLFDSRLVHRHKRELYSRVIYGDMPALSRREGRRLYAIFGVHTPPQYRGQGWATLHFRKLLPHLRMLGAEELELHVYADNTPAVRLYQKSGFREVGRTSCLRKSLIA